MTEEALLTEYHLYASKNYNSRTQYLKDNFNALDYKIWMPIMLVAQDFGIGRQVLYSKRLNIEQYRETNLAREIGERTMSIYRSLTGEIQFKSESRQNAIEELMKKLDVEKQYQDTKVISTADVIQLQNLTSADTAAKKQVQTILGLNRNQDTTYEDDIIRIQESQQFQFFKDKVFSFKRTKDTRNKEEFQKIFDEEALQNLRIFLHTDMVNWIVIPKKTFIHKKKIIPKKESQTNEKLKKVSSMEDLNNFRESIQNRYADNQQQFDKNKETLDQNKELTDEEHNIYSKVKNFQLYKLKKYYYHRVRVINNVQTDVSNIMTQYYHITDYTQYLIQKFGFQTVLRLANLDKLQLFKEQIVMVAQISCLIMTLFQQYQDKNVQNYEKIEVFFKQTLEYEGKKYNVMSSALQALSEDSQMLDEDKKDQANEIIVQKDLGNEKFNQFCKKLNQIIIKSLKQEKKDPKYYYWNSEQKKEFKNVSSMEVEEKDK